MVIYVVETNKDYLCQVGASLSREVAERIAKEYGNDYFVTEYYISKNKFTEFD